jgi:protease-4
MTGIYDLFLARVSEGRRIPVERVAASAEGRIFGGREAKDRGLVDAIGGLAQAIARARSLAGLPADARFGVSDESPGLLGLLTDDEPRALFPASSAVAPAALARLDPLIAPFVDSLAPLATQERAICALPFALTIR